MYIITTDQGYVTKGLPHQGLQFGIREDAKRYTHEELVLHKDILNELNTYYCCEEYQIEYIIEHN